MIKKNANNNIIIEILTVHIINSRLLNNINKLKMYELIE